MGDAGPQDVEPVQRRFRGDPGCVASVSERGVGDLYLEVLAHPVALQRRADRQADLVGPRQGAVRDAVSDLGEVGLSRVQ